MEGDPGSKFEWGNPHNSLVTKLNFLIEQQINVDSTLSPKGSQRSLKFHPITVAPCDAYNEDLLDELPDETRMIFFLDDIRFTNLEALVEYIYGEKVPVSEQHLKTLLEAASSLEMEGQLGEEENHTFPRRISEDTGSVPSSSTAEPDEAHQMIQEAALSPEPNTIMEEEDPDNPDEKNESTNSSDDWNLEFSEDESMEAAGNDGDQSVEQSDDEQKGGESSEDTEDSSQDDNNSSDDPSSEDEDPRPSTSSATPSTGRRASKSLSNTNQSSKKKGCGTEDQDAGEHFSCSQCAGFRTKRRHSLQRHLMNIHGVKKWQLAAFGAGPKVRPTLPALPLNCPQCDKVFKNKDSLKTHLRLYCGKDSSFACTLCEFRNKRKGNLKRHLIGVHGVDTSELPTFGAGPKVRPSLPFKCVQCRRTYSSQMSLNTHSRVCRIEPSFRCEVCNYQAKWKRDLKRHIVYVHSNPSGAP